VPRFGEKSQSNRETLHPHLQCVLDLAIKSVDFAIVKGHRGQKEQDSLFDRGLSKVKFPNSKHNANPSLAADIYPYVETIAGVKANLTLTGHPAQIRQIAKLAKVSFAAARSYVLQMFMRMVGAVLAAAAALDVTLRSGSDWDRDGDTLDQSFNDLCHVEVLL